MTLLALSEIAALIAGRHGWQSSARERLHRQLKHWRASKLLVPAEAAADGRRTDHFAPATVLRARLLLALSDFGLDVDDMASAMLGIDPQPNGVVWSRDATGATVETPFWDNQDAEFMRFDKIAPAAAAGEPFDCRVRISRDDAGNRLVSAYLAPSAYVEPPEILAASHASRVFQGQMLQGRIVIDLTSILRPFDRSSI